ncbi:hypothetical protein HDU88_006495 [Geranomyces variabilis]|nr:hypothetical protein HDU88_006495 [Geranomyces variabilis]
MLVDILYLISKHLNLPEKLKLASVSRTVRRSISWSAADNEQRLAAACNDGSLACKPLVEALLKDKRIKPYICNAAARDAACRADVSIFSMVLEDERTDLAANLPLAFGLACSFGNTAVVKLLLAHDGFVVPDKSNVKCAAFNGHADIVQLLLNDGRFQIGDAVFGAASSGHAAVVKVLLTDSRVDPTIMEDHLLCDSCGNGRIAIVETLLADPRINPAVSNSWPLRFALSNGHEAVAKRLLADPRVDPSAARSAAFRYAAARGFTEIVESLLTDERVDPAACSNEAYRIASRNGDADMVKVLLTDPRVNARVTDADVVRHAVEATGTEEGDEELSRLLGDDKVLGLEVLKQRSLRASFREE